MAKPAISGSPETILISAALVKYKGVNIGLVSGVKLTVKHLTSEVMTDQAGKTPVNDFHVGDLISVEMVFDELTSDKMKAAFPKAALVGSGPTKRVSWGRAIGEDFYSIAGLLEILPTSDDEAYSGRRFTLYKSAPIGDAAIEYGPDKKMGIKANFKVYPDFTKPDGEFLGYFGDIAAGALVPAATGAAVAGGGNVGSGTVSGIFANNNFTLTETWTLACIHAAANGGIFSVTGSVTGARGNATVGSAYVSNSAVPANSEIGLTINDGATDFSVGDSFTIATTASNYT